MGGTYSSTLYDTHKININNQVTPSPAKINKKPEKPNVSRQIIDTKSNIPSNKSNKSFLNTELQELEQYMIIDNMGNKINTKNIFISKDLERKYLEQNKSINFDKENIVTHLIEYNNNERMYNRYLYYKPFLIIIVSILIILLCYILYLFYKRKYYK